MINNILIVLHNEINFNISANALTKNIVQLFDKPLFLDVTCYILW